MNQHHLSKWLIFVTSIAAACGLFCLLYLAPQMGREMIRDYPKLRYMYTPTLIFIYLNAIPCYIAAGMAMRIFVEIGRDNSFCAANAKRLRTAGNMFLINFVLFAAALIVLAVIRLITPTLSIILMLLAIGALVVSVMCAALSHLVVKAAEIKDENDLTI